MCRISPPSFITDVAGPGPQPGRMLRRRFRPVKLARAQMTLCYDLSPATLYASVSTVILDRNLIWSKRGDRWDSPLHLVNGVPQYGYLNAFLEAAVKPAEVFIGMFCHEPPFSPWSNMNCGGSLRRLQLSCRSLAWARGPRHLRRIDSKLGTHFMGSSVAVIPAPQRRASLPI